MIQQLPLIKSMAEEEAGHRLSMQTIQWLWFLWYYMPHAQRRTAESQREANPFTAQPDSYQRPIPECKCCWPSFIDSCTHNQQSNFVNKLYIYPEQRCNGLMSVWWMRAYCSLLTSGDCKYYETCSFWSWFPLIQASFAVTCSVFTSASCSGLCLLAFIWCAVNVWYQRGCHPTSVL